MASMGLARALHGAIGERPLNDRATPVERTLTTITTSTPATNRSNASNQPIPSLALLDVPLHQTRSVWPWWALPGKVDGHLDLDQHGFADHH